MHALGLPDDTLQAKLSQGVVGKTTYAVVALMGVITVIATRLSGEAALLALAAGAIAVFVLYFVMVMGFAERNPAAGG